MRRLIAYIATALALLLAIGVSATPVVTNLNAGREFTNGSNYREIVFNIEEGSDDVANQKRSETVAKQIENRLRNYNVEDYSIKIQGEDSVAVALAMNAQEFNYAAKYISFSGESFALVSSNGQVKNEHKLFEQDDVRIDYQDVNGEKVPIVIIPLTTDGVNDVKELCNQFSPEEGGDNQRALLRKTRAESDSEESDDTPKNYIYLWANYDEGRMEGLDSLNEDPISREKVLMAFDASNIWYQNSKEEAKETELFFVCATGQEDNPNQLDISGLKEGNQKANFLRNMLKAEKYDFELSCPTANIDKTNRTVDYYKNAKVLSASAESIVNYTTNANINVSSKTFIAIAIAMIIISLLLVVYYRLAALAIIVTTLSTLFVTLVSFMSMNVLFNIPALIGFACLAAGVLFGEIIYVNRFKEEVYKGRSLKKANQEASKKSNLVTIDSSIVLAFSGLMLYALGGTALKSMGVVLFFGAVFTLLLNLLLFKLLMYLVTNSTNLQQKYNVFNIEGDKVPNIMAAEEKATYESPYEKVNFTKKKNIFGIVFGALSVAAIACIITFGVISPSKSPLNVEAATSDTTVIYTQISADGELITDSANFVTYVLKETDYEKIDEKKISYSKVSKYIYESDEHKETQEYYFFTLTLDKTLDVDAADTLQQKMETNLYEVYKSNPNDLNKVKVTNSSELVYTPNQGDVALATGIAIVGVALYFAFRFRPSRGIALLVTTSGTVAIAYGAIVAMRFIGTTAVTSVAMPLVAVTMMLASLFYFSTEKAMLKEGHVELDYDTRKDIMIKSLAKSAAPLFVFALVNIYLVINCFGFGVDNTVILFASALIGEIVAVVVLLTILGPLAMGIEKLLRKIRLPKLSFLNREKPVVKEQKRNSSEPEETIFIGIND